MFLAPQHLALVMEHAPGGDMFQYLLQRQALSEAEARWCFQQLIIAVDYCHRVVRMQRGNSALRPYHTNRACRLSRKTGLSASQCACTSLIAESHTIF